MKDYKELIQKREELREELANVNSEIECLARTVFKGKLEKAVALLKEVDKAELFINEEVEYCFTIEGIIESIESYIEAIEERG